MDLLVEVKQESKGTKRKSGGRPLSDGWLLYNFTRLETRGARCGKCQAVIKNTSNGRMEAHFNRCSKGLPKGPGRPTSGVNDIDSIIQNQIELDDSDIEATSSYKPSSVFLSHDSGEFEDESAEVNHVMKIIKGEKRNHQPGIKRSVDLEGNSYNNPAFDAAISSFLIGCNLTFDIIDSPHFKQFVRFMNPGLPCPSSSQLKTRVLGQLRKMQNSAVASRKRNHEEPDSE